MPRLGTSAVVTQDELFTLSCALLYTFPQLEMIFGQVSGHKV